MKDKSQECSRLPFEGAPSVVFEAERGNALRCGPPRKGGVGRNNPKEFVSVRVAANALGRGLHWNLASPDRVFPF